MDAYIAMSIITLVILIDQISKLLAKLTLKNKTIDLLNERIQFTYLENSGMAMGKLSGKYYYFILVTIIALIAFLHLCININFESRIFYSISLCLLIGGTIGNFLDRVLRGYVIDFLTGYLFKKNLPVFNLADFAIMIGGLCTLIFGIIEV